MVQRSSIQVAGGALSGQRQPDAIVMTAHFNEAAS